LAPAPEGTGRGRPRLALRTRATRAPAPLRARGRSRPDARGGGQGVQRDPRAHPPDRSQGAAQAPPPVAVAEAEGLPGVGRSAEEAESAEWQGRCVDGPDDTDQAPASAPAT